MLPPLLCLIFLFGLLLCFPLSIFLLPVLVLKERLYLQEQDAGKGASTVRSFQVQDLDLENRVLFTRHIKNNRPQPLPLCSDMVAILQEYLTYREGKANEPLFPSDADKPMTENGLRCSIADDNRRRGGEKRLPSTFSDTPLPASILSIAEAMRSHSKSC